MARKQSPCPEHRQLADGIARGFNLQAIALCRGGPDLVAALHLAWCAGFENRIGVVAILGASDRIPEQAL